MRVLLVEPYFSGSHKAWAEGLAAASKHEIDPITLPGRFWKWRMFGGTLTLARDAAQVETPDAIIVSDMVDLAAFLGHSNLGDVPSVLYMHENQLTYPLSPTARDDLAYAYMNWSSMVRADQVWFNSSFHFDAVFNTLPGFLRHFPDVRHTGLLPDVIAKSSVVPAGVDLQRLEPVEKTQPPLIIWNQRWEYDKDPVRLFAALNRLAARDVEFRLAVCGENFRNVPAEFEDAKTQLGEQMVHFGFAERHRYEELLKDASIVISTAKHEFFGIAAVEAMAAGAVPIFPNDLSYPELVPEHTHQDTLYETDHELDVLLTRLTTDREKRESLSKAIAPEMDRFSWKRLGKEYDKRLESLL